MNEEDEKDTLENENEDTEKNREETMSLTVGELEILPLSCRYEQDAMSPKTGKIYGEGTQKRD